MTDEPTLDDDHASLMYAVRRQGMDVGEVVLPNDVDVDLRGMRFHYLDWGNGDGPAILFLHGGGLTAHTYDLVCLALRDTYHCLSLDQRGHGDSAWSDELDYDATSHAEDVDAFARRLGLERFVLVGMSMGGMNAITYAAAHPGRLAALVLIDVGPDMQMAGTQRIRRFMAQPLEADSVEHFVERATAFNTRRDPRLLRRSLMHNLRKTPQGKWTWKWDPRPRRSVPTGEVLAERSARLWQRVDRIACPTLVVRGAESDVFSNDNARALVARLGHAHRADVEGAGHTVQGDNPGGLVRELRSFLREHGY